MGIDYLMLIKMIDMKTAKHLLAAIGLMALALVACHNDDEMPGINTLPEGAVHITAGIEEVQTRAPQLDADGAGRSTLPMNGGCTLLREMRYLRHTVMKILLTRPTTAIRFIGKTSARRKR